MYRIFVDDECLYHPHLVSEGYAITSGVVNLELDKTGSADITIPSVNPLYGSIAKMKSMVQVMDDDEELFRGRVLHDTIGFNKSKKMYVEGELGFLIDNIRSPYSYTDTVAGILGRYISTYNEQVESAKRFTVGTVTVNPGTITVGSNDYPTIWDEINRQLLTPYGGHIRTRLTSGVRYIDYLADYDRICGQSIEFGVNLVDIEDYVSAEDLVTVLIPLGKEVNGERVNITSVNSGSLYIADATAQGIYGNIWATYIWDDVDDPATLKTLGQAYLAKKANPIKTMTIKAVDLNFAGVQTDKIRLGDRIRVISRPHGIDSLYQCTRISINLLNPAASTYTFGDIPKTLTGDTADTEQMAASASRAAAGASDKADTSASAALAEAKTYADGLVLNASNAYESDSTKAGNVSVLSMDYVDLIDEVAAKIYTTSNGESRYKTGLLAQDIDAAMTQLGLSPKPILTGTTVDYDELVAILWKAVKDLRDRVTTLEGGS